MALNDIDFIRYLIDLIDSSKNASPTGESSTQAPVIFNIDSNNIGSNNTSSNNVGGKRTQEDSTEDDYNDEEETVISNDQDSEEDEESPLDRDDVFIPPLQAKLEIMKKMAGIEPKHQDLLASDDDEPLDV